MSCSRGEGAGFGGIRATWTSGFSAPEAATHGWLALAPQVGQSRAGGRRRFVVFGMDSQRLACYGARMPETTTEDLGAGYSLRLKDNDDGGTAVTLVKPNGEEDMVAGGYLHESPEDCTWGRSLEDIFRTGLDVGIAIGEAGAPERLITLPAGWSWLAEAPVWWRYGRGDRWVCGALQVRPDPEDGGDRHAWVCYTDHGGGRLVMAETGAASDHNVPEQASAEPDVALAVIAHGRALLAAQEPTP